VQLRAMLEEMAVGDLLGPVGGPDKELTERNVWDRYLVGVLAPRTQPQPVLAKPAVEEDDEETPLLPDELSEFRILHSSPLPLAQDSSSVT
jgi:hypothetical protein